MIDCCTALISFEWQSYLDGIVAKQKRESTETYCDNILNSLQRHKTTLKELILDPYAEDGEDILHNGFAHADKIRSLEALQILKVPSILLLSRYPGNGDHVTQSANIGSQYPLIRNVTPDTLQTLRLVMRSHFTPGMHGVEESLISSLPDTSAAGYNAKVHGGLKRLEMDYIRMSHDDPLPMNLWQISNAFHAVGSVFHCTIFTDIDKHYHRSVPPEAEKNILAHTLSHYGAKGVQMALHFREADLT
ncbi:hypothetical protein NX059_011845 [Plenodomus lindquistii]|nr:hypothetical protein NX059_011845 [Plenodomus lindquistii]